MKLINTLVFLFILISNKLKNPYLYAKNNCNERT
jgi:hypothetical protein